MSKLDSTTVRDYMTTSVVTFTPDMEMQTAIQMIIEKRVTGGPVVDRQGNLIGMLSEKDCLKVALIAGYEGNAGGIVQEYMTRNPRTLNADTSILEAAGLFVDTPYKRLPIMDKGKLIGQISRTDVLRAVRDAT